MEANVDKAAQKSAADLASILESNWHSTHIVQVIDKLDKQNPSIHTLVKHKLGRLVKKVHGKALEKGKLPLRHKSSGH
jgi:3-methyladenine DNA glycosylase AlkC